MQHNACSDSVYSPGDIQEIIVQEIECLEPGFLIATHETLDHQINFLGNDAPGQPHSTAPHMVWPEEISDPRVWTATISSRFVTL